MRKLVIVAVVAGLVSAWTVVAEDPFATLRGEKLWEQAKIRFFPLPTEVPDADNPLTIAKVKLGKTLYFDTRLSKDGNVSCDSCHVLAEFGVDNLPTSPGDGGEFGPRNSPTVLNAALHLAQFWDGRAKDVEEQAGMPILNPIEMGIPSKEFLVERLSRIEGYRTLFSEAFPGEDPPLTYANVEKALGAFERTLLTPSRFDDYLDGDQSALAADEQEGLRKFMELGCSSCHNGYAIGGYSFRKFGLQGDYWEHTKSETIDEGRFAETGEDQDRFVFKVAALRNVAETGPYFHDGSVEDLGEAVRIMTRMQVGLDLTHAETASLVDFL
ncbi:MAG: cytochrome-c peroxidase, partial [Acidobacteriota bacterium]|nr:cytochrome-c peroxidase [Acidobacteriota bacterium]